MTTAKKTFLITQHWTKSRWLSSTTAVQRRKSNPNIIVSFLWYFTKQPHTEHAIYMTRLTLYHCVYQACILATAVLLQSSYLSKHLYLCSLVSVSRLARYQQNKRTSDWAVLPLRADDWACPPLAQLKILRAPATSWMKKLITARWKAPLLKDDDCQGSGKTLRTYLTERRARPCSLVASASSLAFTTSPR